MANDYACRVYLASQHSSLTSGSWLYISWDTQAFDLGGFWTINSPKKLTIPATGPYHVVLCVTFQANANGYRSILIEKNGSAVKSQIRVAVTGSGETAFVSNILNLDSNDYLRARAYQNSGQSLLLQHSEVYCYFAIARTGSDGGI